MSSVHQEMPQPTVHDTRDPIIRQVALTNFWCLLYGVYIAQILDTSHPEFKTHPAKR